MEAKAQARFIRVTPQKSRRVVNEVRGKRVLEAADILRFAPQAVATDVRKVLLSAVANSKVKAENAGETFNEADLLVLEAYVDEGPTMKRIRPRAQGRAGRILKRTSHITIVVGTKETRRRETADMGQKGQPPAGSVWESPLTTGLAGSPTPPPRDSATRTTWRKTSRSASS